MERGITNLELGTTFLDNGGSSGVEGEPHAYHSVRNQSRDGRHAPQLAVVERARQRGTPTRPPHSPQLSAGPLLAALLELQRHVNPNAPSEWLQPFLAVVRSEETSGPITRVALRAVQRFIQAALLRDGAAAAAVVEAVAQCRFEATDPQADQAVLLQLLHVVRALVESRWVTALPVAAVRAAVETVFRMSAQPRLALVLRSAAHETLSAIAAALWRRFLLLHSQSITPNVSHSNDSQPSKDSQPNDSQPLKDSSPNHSDIPNMETPIDVPPATLIGEETERTVHGVRFARPEIHQSANVEAAEGVQFLLEFVANLIYTPQVPEVLEDEILLLGLSLVSSSLQLVGRRLDQFPVLLEIVQQRLCRGLLRVSCFR